MNILTMLIALWFLLLSILMAIITAIYTLERIVVRFPHELIV